MSLKKTLIAHKRLTLLAILLLALVVGVIVADIIDEDYSFTTNDDPKPTPESENDKPDHKNDCKKEEIDPNEKTKADMLAKIKLLGIVYHEEVKGAIEEKINDLDLTSGKNHAVFKVENEITSVTTSEKVNCGWRLSQITSDYVIIESEEDEEIKIRLAK